MLRILWKAKSKVDSNAINIECCFCLYMPLRLFFASKDQSKVVCYNVLTSLV